MVPGSTLMYGSNFWSCTSSPRATSRRPIDAAAMPLPRDETTPPVMKMKRVSPAAIEKSFGLSLSAGFTVARGPDEAAGERGPREPLGRLIPDLQRLHRQHRAHQREHDSPNETQPA